MKPRWLVAAPALVGAGLLGALAAPASAQPRSREVRFAHDAIELAGVLLLPEERAGPLPTIVFIHGSGDSDRSHYWARHLGEFFAANGFAFLLPDKRGSGESAGDWRTADFHDLADDALAAVEHAARLPEVDPARIGVLGFSQGGRVAPIVGARSERVRFVVNASGSAVPFTEQLDHEMRNTFRQAGLGETERDEAMALHRTAERYLRGQVPWEAYRSRLDSALESGWREEAREFPRTRDDWRWEFFGGVIDYDPIPWWRRVGQPILVVYGAEDERDNVPVARSVTRLRAALGEAGHSDYSIEVFEGTGHGLWEAGTHPPRHRDDFLSTLLDWVRARAR